ncbi:putative T6SS immunity periplasmic lipoprotein [Serratia nevei]|uniref:putative T6SS immunity periplasmic lipoprotein n=1 Tax=Serratia nevei TaxID=2703794 RepID=UPI003684DFCF
MKKLTFLVALVLLSGCVQGRPCFYPANVSVKNNRVCISVPDDIAGKRELVGIGIYQPGAGGKAEWSTSVAPGQQPIAVMPGECLAVAFDGFQIGHSYSVEIATVGNASNEAPRKYWTEFTLVADKADGKKLAVVPIQR